MGNNKNKAAKFRPNRGFIVSSLILLLFWIALTWKFDPVSLGLGVFCSLLVSYWSHDLLLSESDYKMTLRRYLSLAKFLPYLLWQILLANLKVAYLILNPRDLIEPVVIRFNPDLQTDMGVVILANAITLTPGTVTIIAHKQEFIVHAITAKDAESLLQGDMPAKVRDIEQGKL